MGSDRHVGPKKVLAGEGRLYCFLGPSAFCNTGQNAFCWPSERNAENFVMDSFTHGVANGPKVICSDEDYCKA